MRKFTFLFMMLFALSAYTMAQTIENFESLKMNIMLGDAALDLSSFTVVPNPDSSDINPSANVVKFLRDKDGVLWDGFYATLANSINLTDNKYVHLKVWKPRLSTVMFKIEGTTNPEIEPINPQTVINGWEELVFDFTSLDGEFTKIVLTPDRIDPLTLTEDAIIYFDDLTINNDPDPGSAPVQIMEDYESIPLNLMLNGANDLSKMTIAPNPDITDLNLSPYVMKFVRDKDGYPWDGFWSTLPSVIDVTTNKYVHVKVWKPRISTLKFKIEGGAAGTVEIPSMNTQTVTNGWQDIVFDFSAKTGTYPIIAFLPDFEDPLTLTDDITMYFDDIILNNDPNPVTGPPQQTINVDMSTSDMVAGEQLFISGALGGIYGNWAMPGTIADNEMFDNDGDGIYSITLTLPDGVVAFKFFIGPDWGHGDEGIPDRSYTINGACNLTYVWGIPGLSNVSVPKSPLAGKIQMFPNPVSSQLNISVTTDVRSVTINSMTGQVVAKYDMSNIKNKTINTSTLGKGSYLVTFMGIDGSRYTQKLMKK